MELFTCCFFIQPRSLETLRSFLGRQSSSLRLRCLSLLSDDLSLLLCLSWLLRSSSRFFLSRCFLLSSPDFSSSEYLPLRFLLSFFESSSLDFRRWSSLLLFNSLCVLRLYSLSRLSRSRSLVFL